MSHRELHDLLTVLRAPAGEPRSNNADDVFAKVDYLYLGQWMDARMRKMLRETSKPMQEMIDKNTPVQSKVVVNEIWFLCQPANTRTAILCKKLSELQKKHPIKELVMTRIKIRNVADVELLVNTLAQLTSLKDLDLSYSQLFERLSRSIVLLKTKSHRYTNSPRTSEQKRAYRHPSTPEETKAAIAEKARREIHANTRKNERRVCEMIFELFQHNLNLENLNLRHTLLSDADALLLVAAVHTNTTLVKLNIEENGDNTDEKCVRSIDVSEPPNKYNTIEYEPHISRSTWEQMFDLWKIRHKPSDLCAYVEADFFFDSDDERDYEEYDSDAIYGDD